MVTLSLPAGKGRSPCDKDIKFENEEKNLRFSLN